MGIREVHIQEVGIQEVHIQDVGIREVGISWRICVIYLFWNDTEKECIYSLPIHGLSEWAGLA